MRKRFPVKHLRLLRPACIGVFLTIVCSTAAAVDLKIMPLGDSITTGLGAGGGYRMPLYNLLTGAKLDFQFVGSQTDNGGGLPGNQLHHEGHVAYTIQNCTTTADGEARTGIRENATTWLTAANPDIVLLMIGTNDINANFERDKAPERLSDLLTTITSWKPSIKVIVAQITPIGDGWASTAASDALAQTYNLGMAAVVANQQAAGKHITLVDMHTPLNAATDLGDGLHPNQSGYNKMGQVWFNGIQTAIAVPEPTSATLSALGAMSIAAAYAWRNRTQIRMSN
jgi:lysophospholipase L1-like esterase